MNSFALRAYREMLLALGVILLAWSESLLFTNGVEPAIIAFLGALLLLVLSRRLFARRLKSLVASEAEPTAALLPRWLLALLAAFRRVVLVFVYFAVLGPLSFGWYAEPRAEQAARNFCGTVQIGEDADAVLERAKNTSALTSSRQTYLRWNGPPEARTLWVTFTGAQPYSRHSCIVEAGATVTATRYLHDRT